MSLSNNTQVRSGIVTRISQHTHARRRKETKSAISDFMVKRRSFGTQYSIRFSRQDNVNASLFLYYILLLLFFVSFQFNSFPYDDGRRTKKQTVDGHTDDNGEPCDNIQIETEINRRTEFHRRTNTSHRFKTTTLYTFSQFDQLNVIQFKSPSPLSIGVFFRRQCSPFDENGINGHRAAHTHTHTQHSTSVICCHFHCIF